MKYIQKIACLGLLFSISLPALTQVKDTITSPFSFNLNADVVSRYVWRGLLFSPNVNIQPYAGISFKGLSLSTWASYGISDKYAEVDFSLSYNYKSLTLGFNDYYNEDENLMSKNRHFNFNEKTTPHLLEAMVSYKMSESLPLTLTGACFFFGYDKNANGNNNYSGYLEASYSFNFSEYNFNVFAGGTTNKGFYADKASIINTGFSAIKNLKITDQFSLPLTLSLISNPHAEDIFLIIKATF